MGCGASSSGKGKYAGHADPVSTPVEELDEAFKPEADAKQRQEVTSYRTTAPAADRATHVTIDGSASPQEVGSEPVAATVAIASAATCQWWSSHAGWIQQRANEILAAYNFFFEHIGLRKGWRTAPFQKEEVQAPFQAAAEVVTVVRARLDEQTDRGIVLRQLEGSSMSFLWGWSPGRPPGSSHEALEDFFRGLVFATLSDGKGLVEGLDTDFVEYYVSRHPIIANGRGGCGARVAAAENAPDAAFGDDVAKSLLVGPKAAITGADACVAGAGDDTCIAEAMTAEVCALGADGDVQGPCPASD